LHQWTWCVRDEPPLAAVFGGDADVHHCRCGHGLPREVFVRRCAVKALTYFLSGLLFSLGLIISGMTRPQKIIGFLDFLGNWDPSLSLVMVGAIAVHFPAYLWVKGRSQPLWSGSFAVPSRRDVDLRLAAGAALFGIGWGLAGYCPGPA